MKINLRTSDSSSITRLDTCLPVNQYKLLSHNSFTNASFEIALGREKLLPLSRLAVSRIAAKIKAKFL
jgi:hypothetical protein